MGIIIHETNDRKKQTVEQKLPEKNKNSRKTNKKKAHYSIIPIIQTSDSLESFCISLQLSLIFSHKNPRYFQPSLT